MKTSKFFFLLLLFIFIASCAESTFIEACTTTEPYGFWGGLGVGTTLALSWEQAFCLEGVARPASKFSSFAIH